MSSHITLTIDQIPEFEKRTGLKWPVVRKQCDFCDVYLSQDHVSKKCAICPTIFDQCKDCDCRDICHKPHNIDHKERSNKEIEKVIENITEGHIENQNWLNYLDEFWTTDGNVNVTELFSDLFDNTELGRVAQRGFPMIASRKNGMYSLTVYKRLS
jgi:hypothetical protein